MKLFENKFVQTLIVAALILFVLGAIYNGWMKWKEGKISEANLVLNNHQTKLNHQVVTGQPVVTPAANTPSPDLSGNGVVVNDFNPTAG